MLDDLKKMWKDSPPATFLMLVISGSGLLSLISFILGFLEVASLGMFFMGFEGIAWVISVIINMCTPTERGYIFFVILVVVNVVMLLFFWRLTLLSIGGF